MLKRSDLYDYQETMVQHLLDHTGAALFAEMGTGKSITTLTAMDELQNNQLAVKRWLVVSTKKIAESVWKQEAALWEHTRHLQFSLILGTEAQRKRAVHAKADVWVINRENLAWLVTQCVGKWWWDGVVLDESSSFKSHDSIRFLCMKKVRPAVKRMYLLTGTPQPKDFLDLWSQLYLMDGGQRLGDHFGNFKLEYFEKDPYKPYTFNLRAANGRNYEQEIADKIKDICISIKAEDYLKLPPRIDRIVNIDLPAIKQREYEEFEKVQVLALPDDKDITVVNAAALTSKLLQFAAGAIYDEEKNWHEVHTEKLDYLDELIENANGQPVLVFYHYRHSLERITARLKTQKKNFRLLRNDQDVQDWNAGKIEVMIAYPQYGLNLQRGGNIIIWFELDWNLELYQQANTRLIRIGQTKPVFIHHLIVKNTMEQEVYVRLISRAEAQESLMQLVKAKAKRLRFGDKM